MFEGKDRNKLKKGNFYLTGPRQILPCCLKTDGQKLYLRLDQLYGTRPHLIHYGTATLPLLLSSFHHGSQPEFLKYLTAHFPQSKALLSFTVLAGSNRLPSFKVYSGALSLVARSAFLMPLRLLPGPALKNSCAGIASASRCHHGLKFIADPTTSLTLSKASINI